MNKTFLYGRLTSDIEIRVSADGQTSVGRVRIAVNRKGKKDEADFISLVAFGKTAEAIEKYSGKGKMIAVAGHIQTGSYTDKNNNKVYTTDVIVDEVDFIEWRDKETAPAKPAPQTDADGFMNIPAGIDEELPFR